MKKKALIFGVTGQDGSYLSELLLKKNYDVIGVMRRSSAFNTARIDHLYSLYPNQFDTSYGDLSDLNSIERNIEKFEPDEIYNLAAQSHVMVSFETPEYTANADALGTLRILEAIRLLGLSDKTRFYQASTSELYGMVQEVPQNEKTPFYPRSPYGVAKLYAYWITVNYREAYNIFACNGILFNHESPIRGETFVTRKITRAAARISLGVQERLYLGNLDSKRDWGHADDYVEGMWKIMQHDKPDDFVLATGISTSIRDFTTQAFSEAGISLEWSGNGVDEVGKNTQTGKLLVSVDPTYFRPTEVDLLIGDATKAKEKLGWSPTCELKQLISEMISSDLEEARKDSHLLSGGFQTNNTNSAG